MKKKAKAAEAAAEAAKKAKAAGKAEEVRKAEEARKAAAAARKVAEAKKAEAARKAAEAKVKENLCKNNPQYIYEGNTIKKWLMEYCAMGYCYTPNFVPSQNTYREELIWNFIKDCISLFKRNNNLKNINSSQLPKYNRNNDLYRYCMYLWGIFVSPSFVAEFKEDKMASYIIKNCSQFGLPYGRKQAIDLMFDKLIKEYL